MAPATGARGGVRKTIAHVWFPAALLVAWRELTKTEIVVDGVAREMCDGLERRISATRFAERANVDPSDARKALRKLLELRLQRRTGNTRDPGGYVVTPATAEELNARFPDGFSIDFAVPAIVVRNWHGWSRLEILVYGTTCLHKEARRRGIEVPSRLTSKWLAEILGEPDRSCRHALRSLADRGVVEADQTHRWTPTTWDQVAKANSVPTAAVRPIRLGNQVPELPAKSPPSSWHRVPRACGNLAPGKARAVATSPPRTEPVRTLSTRARDLPPRDLPPSLHPAGGREGEEMVSRGERDAGLLPLAQTATKLFAAHSVVVDLGHAVRRLAVTKERYGMTYDELEGYVRAAPNQPGLCRAGFPFGAAMSASRVEPWLERHRRIRLRALDRPSPSENSSLAPTEIASRGRQFLASMAPARREHR
jgi:hypothetical protein